MLKDRNKTLVIILFFDKKNDDFFANFELHLLNSLSLRGYGINGCDERKKQKQYVYGKEKDVQCYSYELIDERDFNHKSYIMHEIGNMVIESCTALRCPYSTFFVKSIINQLKKEENKIWTKLRLGLKYYISFEL